MKLSSSLLCYLLQELPPVCALFIPLLIKAIPTSTSDPTPQPPKIQVKREFFNVNGDIEMNIIDLVSDDDDPIPVSQQ